MAPAQVQLARSVAHAATLTRITGPTRPRSSANPVAFFANADFNASVVVKKEGVRAVINGEVAIKVQKKVSITRTAARRGGAVQTDAATNSAAVSTRGGEYVRHFRLRPCVQFSLIQETPV